MAVIRFGPIVSSARGSSGGTVFSANGLGAYIRNRTVPVNPRTPKQEAHRAIMASLNYAWANTLTADERKSWEDYAAGTPIINKLGDQQHLKGLQQFMSTNLSYVSAGGAMITQAPPVTGVISIPIMTILGDTTDGIRIESALAPVPAAGDLVAFFVSPPKKQTVNFFGQGFTSTVYSLGTMTLPFEIIPAGQCIIGQRWFIDVKYVDDVGHASSRYLRQIDITA